MDRDFLKKIATRGAGVQSNEEIINEIICERFPPSVRVRYKVGCVAPHMLPQHKNKCRCDDCATGTSKRVWAGIDPSCGCGGGEGEEPVYLRVPMDQTNCPAASIPWDIWQAKTNPLYDYVWSCFDYQTVAFLLDGYSDYSLCVAGGEWSVLLAATHFVQLHTLINQNFAMAAAKQSSLGRAVTPMHPAIQHNRGTIASNYHSNHWSMTTHGLQYQSMRKPAAALAGMAYGL